MTEDNETPCQQGKGKATSTKRRYTFIQFTTSDRESQTVTDGNRTEMDGCTDEKQNEAGNDWREIRMRHRKVAIRASDYWSGMPCIEDCCWWSGGHWWSWTGAAAAVAACCSWENMTGSCCCCDCRCRGPGNDSGRDRRTSGPRRHYRRRHSTSCNRALGAAARPAACSAARKSDSSSFSGRLWVHNIHCHLSR